jgi:predicted heme/steroid binding protein
MPKRKYPESSESADADRQISWEELKMHNKDNDCWIAIDGIVYDVSKYLNAHPGGKGPLLAMAGKDATQLFLKVHKHPKAPDGTYEGEGGTLHAPLKPESGQVARIGVLFGDAPDSPDRDTVSQAPEAPESPSSSKRPTGPPKVAELRVFPVKSCGSGAAVDEIAVDYLGPQHDRCLMVCHKPCFNNKKWQDTWGAVTPRTIPADAVTPETRDEKQVIYGPSLLLVDVTMNPDATMTISSKNEARRMPDLRIAVKPPVGAPLIDNVPFFSPPFETPLPFLNTSRYRSHVGTLKALKPMRLKKLASGSLSALLLARCVANDRCFSHSFHVPARARKRRSAQRQSAQLCRS